MKHKADPKKLCETYEKLKNRHSKYLQRWQDAHMYCLPWGEDDSNFPRINHDLGIRSLRDFAHGIYSNTFSPDRPNMHLEADEEIDQVEGVKEWLNQATEELHREMVASNFGDVYRQVLFYGGANGQGITFTGWEDGLYFREYTVPECTYVLDRKLDLCQVWREYELTVNEAVEEFGETKLSKRLQAMYKENHLDPTPCKFLHVVYKRPKAEIERLRGDAANQPWASVYIDQGDQDQDRAVVKEGGYTSNPYALFQFYRCPDGLAVGPGVCSIPDLRELNELESDITDGIELGIQPPLFVPSALRDDVSLKPGEVNYYDPADGIPQEYTTQIDIASAMEQARRKELAIQNQFMLPLLYNLTQGVKGRQTATEVTELVDEKILALAPVVVGVQTQYLPAVYGRALELMVENGQIEQPPEILQAAGAIKFRLQSRLTARFNEIQIQMAFRAINEITKLHAMAAETPEIGDHLKLDVATREILHNYQVSADIIRPERDAKQRAKARAEAEASMMQAEQAQQALQPINPNEAPEPGSPMEQMSAMPNFAGLRGTLGGTSGQ